LPSPSSLPWPSSSSSSTPSPSPLRPPPLRRCPHPPRAVVLMSTAPICRSRRKLIVVFLPGHHLPLLFSGLAQLPLVVTLNMSHRGCGVAATATAIPAVASGEVWLAPVWRFVSR
jgi:hypothetical protein